MKKLALFFSLSLFSLSSTFAQETFTYKDINIINDSRKQADQALCINKENILTQSMHNSNGTLDIDFYNDPTWKTRANANYAVPGEPHDLVALKRGGYASCGRNSFLVTNNDAALSPLYSIGSKMLDWRVQTTNPDYTAAVMEAWKHNDVGTGTAVDFLELAETPDGNYVCAVFLFHRWKPNGAAQMNLGLAISDLSNGGKMTIHDLNMPVNAVRTNSIMGFSEVLDIACIDNSHLVINYVDWASDDSKYQMTVINFKKILEGLPLNAQVWQGKLHPELKDPIAGGIFAENGILYYSMGEQPGSSDKIVYGKAKWDGSKLSIVQSKSVEYGFADMYTPSVAANLSNDYFIFAGSSSSDISEYSSQPYVVRIKKSDLTPVGKTAIIKGSERGLPFVLDAVPLSNTKGAEQIALLYREKATGKGTFYLSTIQFND